jgi:hypothetical protein
MSSTASLSVSGYAISDLAHNNSDLLTAAKRLGQLTAEIRDPALQKGIADEVNKILDVVERNDRVIRSVIPVR